MLNDIWNCLWLNHQASLKNLSEPIILDVCAVIMYFSFVLGLYWLTPQAIHSSPTLLHGLLCPRVLWLQDRNPNQADIFSCIHFNIVIFFYLQCPWLSLQAASINVGVWFDSDLEVPELFPSSPNPPLSKIISFLPITASGFIPWMFHMTHYDNKNLDINLTLWWQCSSSKVTVQQLQNIISGWCWENGQIIMYHD